MSMRFSKAIHMDTYNSKANGTSGLSYLEFLLSFLYYKMAASHQTLSDPLMLGAAASAFYINDAATILPRSIVAKTSAYLAGAAADVLEVKKTNKNF